MKLRNTQLIVRESLKYYQLARSHGLVHNHIHNRNGKRVILDDNKAVVDFINCSYFGLDQHPKVVEAYHSVPKEFGVNFCCARTRLTMANLRRLEERLSRLFLGRAITFPSVTATHMSSMPLIASGVLLDNDFPPRVHMVFDRLAHASMKFLMPILEKECRISVIAHNDIHALVDSVRASRLCGEKVVYVADGVYSMGGICPIRDLLTLSEREDFYLYIDDAHGTSIFGERGEGLVLGQISGKLPKRLLLTFSMTKGFGVAGGGIVVSDEMQEELIRTYGQVYAFSAPLDYSSTLAALAVIDLHCDGTIKKLQEVLRRKVALFDSLMGNSEPFSPIRTIRVGSEHRTIEIGKRLLDRGFLTVTAFFPVVARNDAQLRVCISTLHTDEEIAALASEIKFALDLQEIACEEPAYAL